MMKCMNPDVLAGKPCHILTSDDWDELEDSCSNCGWWEKVKQENSEEL